MRQNRAAVFVLFSALAFPSGMVGQLPPPDTPAASTERDISWKRLFPNIVNDQAKIWLFPLKLGQARTLVPTVAVVGATAGLVALDPSDAPYFRRTSSFNGFNRVFSGSTTSYGTIAVPVSMYVVGRLRHDSKMQKTALLIGEAVADSEIVTTVFKDSLRRVRPAAISPQGNFSDTWFDSKGSFWRGNGSMPSGHTIAAVSVATVIARRYGNHRWVPYVAYGMAGLVGFSRVTLSAHFVSDVFVGGALGYSISRYAVLRQ